MDMDPMGNRGREGFPTEQPMQMLKKDHDFVKKLFDRYLDTEDILVKQEAGPRILMLLEMHTALEEAIFYPKVRQIDPSLVDECKEEHEQADQLLQHLKGMDHADPQCDRLFQQLADAILHHIDVEENRLFPAVRQAHLDLEALGLEMQAFEANSVAMQAEVSERKNMTTNRSAPPR